jgi:hypothetical protein
MPPKKKNAKKKKKEVPKKLDIVDKPWTDQNAQEKNRTLVYHANSYHL